MVVLALVRDEAIRVLQTSSFMETKALPHEVLRSGATVEIDVVRVTIAEIVEAGECRGIARGLVGVLRVAMPLRVKKLEIIFIVVSRGVRCFHLVVRLMRR